MPVVTVACVQLNSRDDMAVNIDAACAGVREAAAKGAVLVSLPEYVALMDGSGRVMRTGVFSEAAHPALAAFRTLARECRVTLHVGSLTVSEDDELPFNRGYVIGPGGEILAHYDKIHMFDIVLPNGREAFESRAYRAGAQAVVVRSACGVLGLSICTDLRFPHLFARLREAGAEIALVPASFLPATGADHWHVLLRARAIDTGMFVMAAAMSGHHGNNRASYGHSLIVDPWGRVLADAGEAPGVVTATLDLDDVASMRAKNPWLRPAPDFAPPACA